MKSAILVSLVIGLSSGLASGAERGELTQFGNGKADKEQWIEALALPPPLPSRGGAAVVPAPRAAAAQIQFELNSAELTEAGKEVLNQLGAALTDARLAGNYFVLEGHTDATGDATYNQALSERRAQTVLNYLMSVWGLPADQLDAVGRGMSALLYPEDPASPRNRAVVVINQGSTRNTSGRW